MLYEVNGINELTGQTSYASFSNEEDRDSEIQRQIAKQNPKGWGKSKRWIKTSELSANLVSRVLQTRMVTLDGDEYEESEVKDDYIITESTQDNSLELVHTARKKEYPTVEEFVHVFFDHGPDSPEMDALRARRSATKTKFELP